MDENNKKFSFEQAMKRLEEISQTLQTGDLPIEEALKLFEEGTSLLRSCNKTLEEAEKKVSILVGRTSDDEPIIETFTDTETKQ